MERTLNRSIDSYVSIMGTKIKDQIFKVLGKESSRNGPGIARLILLSTIAKVVADLVFTTLKTKSKNDKGYVMLKESIEMAVSNGFASAFSEYAERQTDFIVQVKSIAEPETNVKSRLLSRMKS